MNRLLGLAQRMLMAAVAVLGLADCSVSARTDWPPPTAENKPWTRWWWMGSAVDEPNLTYLLEEYSRAGIGGVEICPIYGAKGYEERFVDFLSPEWMRMLAYTTAEAKRLGMGVDLTTGTGWPFGGPQVKEEAASMKVLCERYSASGGQVFEATVPKSSRARLICLIAAASDGRRVDLTAQVSAGKIRWEVPAGDWTIYELAGRRPVQKVKRAAPGGEGNVVDPYSVSALEEYLSAFDKAFAGFKGSVPRAHFHDSFEYFDADWTGDFLEEFRTRRGYDLRDYLEFLFGEDSSETAARVKCDYRQTLSDLHIAYIERWTQWCHRYGSLSRNQAHGAPAHLIDLYAAADIPETEIFRAVDPRQIPMLKMASSAAHLKGQTLSSSESFTWLKEHFLTTLADTKAAADFLFLSGVNHIFFHGIPYSPQDAPWPGWQFYASVNFGPGGGLWEDLPAFTAYLTRCQSILQDGKPDNEILLYWPIFDIWQDAEGLYLAFRIHNQEQWFYDTPFYKAAAGLWSKGYGYDIVSDRFLQKASVEGGRIVLGRNSFSAVLVPSCRVMPTETFQSLLNLAKQGGVILFDSALPSEVPGLKDWQGRQKELKALAESLVFEKETSAGVRACRREKGTILLGEDVEAMLRTAGIVRETCTDAGIQFVRRTHPEGHYYFLINQSEKPLEQWLSLGRPARSAVLMDPLNPERIGRAAVREKNGQTQVYLQMAAGQSLILKTYSEEQAEGPVWTYSRPGSDAVGLEGSWAVEFLKGGPVLPKSRPVMQLGSWTSWGDEEAERFAGTARYTLEFEKPAVVADDWLLDLGKVCESARVRVNGREVGTVWTPPFVCRIGRFLQKGRNKLEVDVTNLAANRIRDMDRRQVRWKYFYDINLVNINYKPFDASEWPLRDSGLLGPVRLIAMKGFSPSEEKKEQEKPSLFIIGDSTVKNNTTGLQGWGDPIAEFFDLSKISVQNRAIGGRSSRTFLTEGRWQKVLEEMKEGDFLLIQFGHNDNGPLASGRARASLKGIGDETKEVVLEATGQKEVVHTYGWYLRKYIREAKAKGVFPILLSPVPRNMWKDGKNIRAGSEYAQWAGQIAQAEGVPFINLNETIACFYEQLGQERVTKEYFLEDHTHTTPAGARVNAQMVVQGIREMDNCPLKQYLK